MRRRDQLNMRIWIAAAAAVIVVGGVWLFWPGGDTAREAEAAGTPATPVAETNNDIAQPVLAAREPEPEPDEVLTPVGGGGAAVESTSGSSGEESAEAEETEPILESQPQPQPVDDPPAPTVANDDATAGQSQNPRIVASLKRYADGHVLEARQELNRMLMISRDKAEQAELRRHLSRIADETVFSRTLTPGDPLFEAFVIKSGDLLINIGKDYNVPSEALMLINGISNPNRVGIGQRLKVPKGPFNAKVDTSALRLDLYLQDLYLRSYRVAVGADQGTPLGEWSVKERLPNPTYYPPAAAAVKKIIPPRDPRNPLGTRWIGLEGTEGGAVGCIGYGIHGTNEPDKIGQPVSLGCIRMRNEDVEFVYNLMMPGHSKVTTLR